MRLPVPELIGKADTQRHCVRLQRPYFSCCPFFTIQSTFFPLLKLFYCETIAWSFPLPLSTITLKLPFPVAGKTFSFWREGLVLQPWPTLSSGSSCLCLQIAGNTDLYHCNEQNLLENGDSGSALPVQLSTGMGCSLGCLLG